MGLILFPKEYPLKPPGIMMTTPNGRFQPDTRICFSMSDYHPETWSPVWTVRAVLVGLLSFMCEDKPTTGSINTSVARKKALAKLSWINNRQSPKFRELFPKLAAECDRIHRSLDDSGELSTQTVSDEKGICGGIAMDNPTVVFVVIFSVLMVPSLSLYFMIH